MLIRGIITFLFLICCFQFQTKANDISKFEIEGMSIGDSLLDFFTENEMNNMAITEYPKNDKYIMFGYNSTTKFKSYEAMSFHTKKNDKRLKIHAIKAGHYFKKNFNECFLKKSKL